MSTTSIIEKACESCNAELYASHVPQGRLLRCSACGGYSTLGNNQGRSSERKMIIWSIALAVACVAGTIASIVALFTARTPIISFFISIVAGLLGIAAFVISVRTLYRSRYRRTSDRAKMGLVLGAMGTGCFGLPVTAFMTLIAGVGGLVVASMHHANTEEQAVALQQQMFEIDIQDSVGLKATDGAMSSLMLVGHIDYVGIDENEEEVRWLRVARFPGLFEMNRAQFLSDLESLGRRILGNELERIDHESFKWSISGDERDVEHISWEKKVDVYTEEEEAQIADGTIDASTISPTSVTRKYEQYHSLFKVDRYFFGLIFVHEPAQSGVTEDDIKTIFESFEMVEE